MTLFRLKYITLQILERGHIICWDTHEIHVTSEKVNMRSPHSKYMRVSTYNMPHFHLELL